MLDQIASHLSIGSALGIFLSLCCLNYVVYRYRQHRQILRIAGYPPERRGWVPWGLDLIYQGVKTGMEGRNIDFWHETFMNFGNAYNPYTVYIRAVGERMIFTADPDNIKAILATQFNDFGKGARFNSEWHEFLGDGIFTTDGEKWHNARSTIRPQFIKDRISDLHIFERGLNDLFPLLGGSGETVDCLQLFYAYTLDSATEFLLGKSVYNLRNLNSDFPHAFNEVQRIQNIIARLGPVNKLWPRSYFRQQLKIVNEFVQPIVDQALALSPEELEKKTKSDDGYTFLHAIATNYPSRDPRALRDQIVNILLAGRDTTACTLSWLFFELSQRPDIVAKLRREIVDNIGTDNVPPTYAQMKKMRYLQHCLNEALRLYPSVPFNVRVALHDTTLPRGGGARGTDPVTVLAGEQIGYTALYLQRRPDLYPTHSASGGIELPPVLKFEPDRWQHWTPRPWTYVPFNGGPRICVGQQFALTEMAYTVIRLLQRFERVESREGGRVPGHKSDIVLSPEGGVKVAFFEGEGLGSVKAEKEREAEALL